MFLYGPRTDAYVFLSATAWKSGWRIKESCGRGIGFVPMLPAVFSVRGNRMFCVWKFVKKLGIILMLRVNSKLETEGDKILCGFGLR